MVVRTHFVTTVIETVAMTGCSAVGTMTMRDCSVVCYIVVVVDFGVD